MLKRMQNFAFTHSLLSQGESFVLGISGGPDSVCLAHILAMLREKYAFSLHIVHINYRLRGKESDRDEQSVRELGKMLDIPVSVFRPRAPKNPSENTMRDIRYERFESVRKRLKYDTVAVGHNQNDQAETLLLHLLRGCGLRGMTGMRPKNGRVIRPLLGISRKDILTYLKTRGIPYRMDKTNTQPIYARNAVRLRLLPYLAKNFQPKIVEILARSAESIAEDYTYIEKMTPKLGNTFSAQAFLAQPESMQRTSLRNLIHANLGKPADVTAAHIQELLKMLRSTKNKTHTVAFHGLKLMRKGDTVRLQMYE